MAFQIKKEMKRIYSIMFGVSMTLTLLAVIALASYGLRLGVDFRGGSVLELSFSGGRPEISSIQTVLGGASLLGKDFSLTSSQGNGIIVRTGELSEAQHQAVVTSLKSAFPKAGLTEQKFDSVGPTVGKELQNRSTKAVIFVLVAIVIYIAIVFRGMSRVLSPWIMGIAAIVALLHDVILPLGVFALLGHTAGIEVTAVFVAAVLTILGYSISDTVVVFDRVRENVLRKNSQETFAETVHKSIMQTLVRSLNTSATTLLSLIAVYFFGGESVKYFALALIIGIIAGTYSSIFIASPILVWWSGRKKR